MKVLFLEMFSNPQIVFLALLVLWLPGFSVMRFFLGERKQKSRGPQRLGKKDVLLMLATFWGSVLLSIAMFRGARIFLEGRLLVVIYALAASIALAASVDLFIEYHYPLDKTKGQKTIKTFSSLFMFLTGLAIFVFVAIIRSAPGSDNRALVMDVPFRGEWSVVTGGRFKFMNYHHGNPDSQNYAVDFVKRGYIGASRGKKIYAPVNGLVIKAVGDQKEGVWEPPEGNIVIIQTENGSHVWLCHLEEGSVKVSVGDEIKADMEIAKCGASGGADLPHLHLHAEKNGKPVPMLLGARKKFPIRGDIISGDID